MITLTIPMKIESLNKVLRWHWATRGRVKRQWKDYLTIVGHRKVDGHTPFHRIEILSRRKKLVDEDNLSPKILIDAIKELGWIVDDNPNEITTKVEQEKCKAADECTVIGLE